MIITLVSYLKMLNSVLIFLFNDSSVGENHNWDSPHVHVEPWCSTVRCKLTYEVVTDCYNNIGHLLTTVYLLKVVTSRMTGKNCATGVRTCTCAFLPRCYDSCIFLLVRQQRDQMCTEPMRNSDLIITLLRMEYSR